MQFTDTGQVREDRSIPRVISHTMTVEVDGLSELLDRSRFVRDGLDAFIAPAIWPLPSIDGPVSVATWPEPRPKLRQLSGVARLRREK